MRDEELAKKGKLRIARVGFGWFPMGSDFASARHLFTPDYSGMVRIAQDSRKQKLKLGNRKDQERT